MYISLPKKSKQKQNKTKTKNKTQKKNIHFNAGLCNKCTTFIRIFAFVVIVIVISQFIVIVFRFFPFVFVFVFVFVAFQVFFFCWYVLFNVCLILVSPPWVHCTANSKHMCVIRCVVDRMNSNHTKHTIPQNHPKKN